MTDPISPVEAQAFKDRRMGRARNGTVDLRSFDEGIVRSMNATLIDPDGTGAKANYWLQVPGVPPAPGKPGVLVTFAYPEDVFEKHFLPAVVVRRDDISAAMQRWHPDGLSYLAPAKGARPITATIPGRGTVTSWDRTEAKRQLEPVDIMYTVSILARHRQGIGGGVEANAILMYILRFYQAAGPLEVLDDLGDTRTYEVFREGISMLDDLPDVAGRIIGFAITLRVEAELDLDGIQEYQTVGRLPTTSLKQNGE